MDAGLTFTDKLVNEILSSNLSIDDQKILIYKRYSEKGFTMIGARKEIRITEQRIQDNLVNKFDDIISRTLIIISGCVSYLVIDSIFKKGIIFKIILPIVTIAVLTSIFSNTLKEMRDKAAVYKLCLTRLIDILEDIEKEYNKVEIRRIIEEDLEEGNIFSINKTEDEMADECEDESIDEVDSVEIDSFDFDLDDLEEDFEAAS